MEIRWLRRALKNLDQEAAFIAEDDPDAARLVVQRIRQAIAMLAENPALGRIGRVPGTRELVVPKTRYLIPYRVRDQRIEILRVFHAARKPPPSW